MVRPVGFKKKMSTSEVRYSVPARVYKIKDYLFKRKKHDKLNFIDFVFHICHQRSRYGLKTEFETAYYAFHFFTGSGIFKVVISGKYKNLNNIAKIKHTFLKFHRLLIFVILHSLQCKIEGHAV